MTDWIAADWPAPDEIVAGTTLCSYPSASLPVAGAVCTLNQVHGANVVIAREYESPPDADASVGVPGGPACVVRTADCLPVLLCSDDGQAFAAAHAGWRGLAAGVLERTVEALPAEPGAVMAWLGPAISQMSFEVGDEVKAAFVDVDAAAADCFLANDRGRWQANLYALARQRLKAAGVRRIYGGGFCTYLDKTRFYSYRRNPDCGRMQSFIGLNTP